jgi:glutaredoxin-related protein
MKPFTAYLRDLHRNYDFKVKIAGDLPENMKEHITLALSQYKVEKCSAGKRLPIAETHLDFPTLKNQSVTIFDVTTAYPTTSQMVRNLLADRLKANFEFIKVRSLQEDQEIAINHEHDEPTDKARLNQHEMEFTPGGQDLVGEKHKMALLKELNKQKHTGEQYKGVNDEILAKAQPQHVKETPVKQPLKINTSSAISSKGPKLQPVRTGHKI